MFKNLGALASMMGNLQSAGAKMQEINEKLQDKRVEASAGGGLVRVEANGKQEILACHIEPNLLAQQPVDQEMLEDLIASATNLALEKARNLHKEMIQEAMGDMGMPGMDEAMAKFFGGGK